MSGTSATAAKMPSNVGGASARNRAILAPDGSASSFTYAICRTERVTSSTISTGSPLPAGGGAFCSMIGTPTCAIREKNVTTSGAFVNALGAMTMTAAALVARACSISAIVCDGSVADAPTISGTRSRDADATVSTSPRRSSVASVSYSLATPGYTTPSAPASIA